MSQDRILFARQPIFDKQLHVVAYELLFRSSDPDRALVVDADRATSEVLLNAFTEQTIDEVVGKHKAFVNFTRAFVSNPPPFAPGQLVVELLEHLTVDEQLVKEVGMLRAAGYEIALDDFVLDEHTDALVPLADIIKLDVLEQPLDDLKRQVQTLRRRTQATLLAEKIETHEQFEQCAAMGFHLFQGYFLSKPKLVHGNRRVDENRQTLLQLLSELNNPQIDMAGLENVIARDSVLSYKLLRLINSSAFHFVREIDSLRQAITLLGIDQIKRWATLLALANAGNKPRELSVTTLVRARMCQLLGEQIGDPALGAQLFTIGLLSNVDAFFDQPLPELLDRLRLSHDITDALLHRQGRTGQLLDAVIKVEEANWSSLDWPALARLGLGEGHLAAAYTESLGWLSSNGEDLLPD